MWNLQRLQVNIQTAPWSSLETQRGGWLDARFWLNGELVLLVVRYVASQSQSLHSLILSVSTSFFRVTFTSSQPTQSSNHCNSQEWQRKKRLDLALPCANMWILDGSSGATTCLSVEQPDGATVTARGGVKKRNWRTQLFTQVHRLTLSLQLKSSTIHF